MTDISPLLNSLLKEHRAPLIAASWGQSSVADEFLKEAYRITSHISSLVSYLRSVRQAYLSTSPPPRRTHYSQTEGPLIHQERRDRTYLTDKQRDQIDAESKRLIGELNAAIRNLSAAEQLHQSTEDAKFQKKYGRRGLGAFGRWAAGGTSHPKSQAEEIEEARLKANKAHRDSVLWYLQRKLEECLEVQKSMMETRIKRELEKNKSVLYKSRGVISQSAAFGESSLPPTTAAPQGSSWSSPGNQALQAEEDEKKAIEQQLDPEQLQLFAKENQDLLKHYEDTLDKVRVAEKSLLEISDLHSTLATNLDAQSTQIDQLVTDSVNITENVGKANMEMKKASERKSTAKTVFYASSGLCLFLIVWDLII
ncbi:MAG: hypothetical protein M1834_003895 [Cirrosporium novae-zelandiae]|nr:MAG: hypothetical protein M1834_003895 [Cirrosporium novae-zelandiae]